MKKIKAKVKVTYEWEVELEEKWYKTNDDPIQVEKDSFKRDPFMFMDAMDHLDANGKESIEIERIE